MSVISKKYNEGGTQLNKLKFVPYMDRGNGPLVTKRIPSEVNPEPPRTGELQTRADDLSRITQLFVRKEGLGYLTNNTNLNLSVDQSYTVQGTFKDKLKALNDVDRGSALRDTLGTLGSTLAQVPVAGTGVHFVKGKLFGSPDTSFNKPSKTVSRVGNPGGLKVKYGRDKHYQYVDRFAEFDAADKVNLHFNETGNKNPENADDFIKFFFQVINPGETQNTFLYFRAFLDSFDDNYTGNWTPYNYVGRGEQFYTYNTFDRTINVSFKSAVATKFELQPVYKKLVYLASTTAPTYSDNGVMRGTIIRANIGDYLSDTPGFINSVNYSWETRYPFEIAAGKKDENAPQGDPRFNSDLTLQELPHVLNCSISFTPIHTFTPQTGLYHYITNPTEGDSQFFPVKGESETSNNITEEQQRNADRLSNFQSRGSLESGF